MGSSDAKAVVDDWVEAYNGKEFGRLEELTAEGVYVLHHNRGAEANNRKELFGLFEAFGAAFPDRRFSDRRSVNLDGDVVIVQHTWGGTAAVDVPGFAAAGEKVSLELCTVVTVKDGQIVEYHDYG